MVVLVEDRRLLHRHAERFGEAALGPTGAVLSLLAVLSLPVVARMGQAGMAKRANSPTITS